MVEGKDLLKIFAEEVEIEDSEEYFFTQGINSDAPIEVAQGFADFCAESGTDYHESVGAAVVLGLEIGLRLADQLREEQDEQGDD